jgi:hypothetical protein
MGPEKFSCGRASKRFFSLDFILIFSSIDASCHDDTQNNSFLKKKLLF